VSPITADHWLCPRSLPITGCVPDHCPDHWLCPRSLAVSPITVSRSLAVSPITVSPITPIYRVPPIYLWGPGAVTGAFGPRPNTEIHEPIAPGVF